MDVAATLLGVRMRYRAHHGAPGRKGGPAGGVGVGLFS